MGALPPRAADWSGDARPDDLASRPRYERRERDGQRGYALVEYDRERYTTRAGHEYGHAESHGCEPMRWRRRDEDWERLPGDLDIRRVRGSSWSLSGGTPILLRREATRTPSTVAATSSRCTRPAVSRGAGSPIQTIDSRRLAFRLTRAAGHV